jgi:hypothetical protein
MNLFHIVSSFSPRSILLLLDCVMLLLAGSFPYLRLVVYQCFIEKTTLSEKGWIAAILDRTKYCGV